MTGASVAVGNRCGTAAPTNSAANASPSIAYPPAASAAAAHRGADEVAGLERSGSHARDAQPQLGRETEPACASGERATAGDEAENGEGRDAEPHGWSCRIQHGHGHGCRQRECDEQAAVVRVDPTAKEEVPRHVDERPEPECEAGRRDREVVRLLEQRSHVDERASPTREGEQLSDRPATDSRMGEHKSEAGPRPCRW